MATAAAKKKTTTKKKPGTSLATMKDLEGLYLEEGKAAAEAAPVTEGVPRISTRSEQFGIGDRVVGDEIEVIVVAESLLNVWYEVPYDPDEKSPPSCFAIGPATKDGDKVLHAHPTSPNRQGGVNDFDCATCDLNKFGTAEVGKGKACANKRELAVVFSDDPGFENDQELKWAILGLSPTSLTAWAKFVQGIFRVEKRPPHGVIVTFAFDKKNPNERMRKSVMAKAYRKIDVVSMARKINALRKQIVDENLLIRPLPVTLDPKPDKPAKKGKSVPAKAAKTAQKKTAGRSKF